MTDISDIIVNAFKHVTGLDKTGELIDPDNAGQLVLVPSHMSAISMEKHAWGRYRKRLQFGTTDLLSYCDYIVKTNAVDDVQAIVCVDAKNGTSKAIFNHDEDGHCDDVAGCTLEPEPMYCTVLEGMQSLNQREALDWIADYSPWLPEAAKLKTVFERLEAKKMSEAEQVQTEFRTERSAMEQIKIIAGGDEGKPPASFVAEFIPYPGFQTRFVEYNVSSYVDVQRKEIVLRFRPLRVEELKQLIATEFVELISDKLGYRPQIGTLSVAP